jgi:hypothetical protein
MQGTVKDSQIRVNHSSMTMKATQPDYIKMKIMYPQKLSGIIPNIVT